MTYLEFKTCPFLNEPCCPQGEGECALWQADSKVCAIVNATRALWALVDAVREVKKAISPDGKLGQKKVSKKLGQISRYP